MDVITADDDYEIVAFRRDPVYDDFMRAIPIIKQFIIKNKLVVYGGTAIDFALRLKGGKLYSDDSPKAIDLDFYSSTHADHAYELAIELYESGFTKSRVINATHYSTMRVDIVDNHFIADISYLPEDVLKSVPTLTYQGMLFVHPHFQALDVHSSLSFPYYGSPFENIFNRWKKDITRLNMLLIKYPLGKPEPVKKPTHLIKINTQYILQGFSAYAVIKHIIGEKTITKIGNDLNFLSQEKYADIIHHNPAKFAPFDAKYEPFGTIIPEIYIVGNLRIFSSENELVSINEVEIEGAKLRVANIQTTLRWFLGMYYKSGDKMYLAHYLSLMQLINRDESIFKPSIMTYGAVSKSQTHIINQNKLYSQIYGDVIAHKMPTNYYPARGNRQPVFDYDSIFFQMSGKKIE
jgi:hypothetical protein